MSGGTYNYEQQMYQGIQCLLAGVEAFRLHLPGCRFLCRRIAPDPARPVAPL